MIVLYQFPPAFDLPNASPFCMKLETWLRMADLEYQVQPVSDTRRAPLGKMPWIEDAGKVIGDSSLIIEHLKATRSYDPEVALLKEQRALALAVQRLVENHLSFAMVHYRWLTDSGWAQMRSLFQSVPAPIRPLVTRMVRRKIARDLRGHGLGLHPTQTIMAFAKDDLSAISELLGQGPFLFGNQPTTIDTVIFASFANFLRGPMEASIQEHCRCLPNLVKHFEEMKSRFFPEMT